MLIIGILLFPTIFSIAQVPDCPPANQNCNNWGYWDQRTWNLESPYCQITIEYRRRVCQPGNIEELEYRNLQVTGNCSFMQNFSIYHYSINSLHELVDLLLIEDLENSLQYDDECPCPNVKLTRKFYTASCGIWVNCTYDISNTQPVCEQGFDLPLPHYNDGNGDKVKVWRWQSCGQTCCERVYQVCKAPSATHSGSFVIQIQAMQKNRIAACTQAPDGSNPKYAKPCEDGC